MKTMMAGARVVMMTFVLLRSGIRHITRVRADLLAPFGVYILLSISLHY